MSRSGAPLPVKKRTAPTAKRQRTTDSELASYRATALRVLEEHERRDAAPAQRARARALLSVAGSAGTSAASGRSAVRRLRRRGGEPCGGEALVGANTAAGSIAIAPRLACRLRPSSPSRSGAR